MRSPGKENIYFIQIVILEKKNKYNRENKKSKISQDLIFKINNVLIENICSDILCQYKRKEDNYKIK